LTREVTDASREELYKIVSYQPELGYHTGCAHCGGTFTFYSETHPDQGSECNGTTP
jgi:hypothetical protein